MKNYFKQSFLIAFLSLTAFTGRASEVFPLLVADKESKTLILEISSRAEVTSLKLLDNADKIIYSETITKQSGGVMELDMKRFADGTYTFETDDALRKMAYTITKNKTEFKIIDKNEIVKPLVKLEGKKLSVLFLNKGGKSVSIKLYDARDRELRSDIVNEPIIQKTYNLGRTCKGKYKMVIVDSNDTYQHEVLFK